MRCDHGGCGPTAGLFLGSPASHTSTQDDVTPNQVSVLEADGVGGFFEVTAVGMSRDEVLAVAEGVQRVSVEDFLDLGSEISWDLQTAVMHDSFAYQIPSFVEGIASKSRWRLGLTYSGPGSSASPTNRRWSQLKTVRSSKSDNGPQKSSLGILYLTVPEDTIDDAVLTLDNEPSILGVTLSPEHSQQRITKVRRFRRGSGDLVRVVRDTPSTPLVTVTEVAASMTLTVQVR
jgi:hypothetical protein